MSDTVADLRAEGAELDALVAGLGADEWHTDTPAPGWTIAHQIGHLAWTDDVALLAVSDHDGFADLLREAAADPTGLVDARAEAYAGRPPGELLAGWRAGRGRLADALAAADPAVRLPWFGPPMAPRSMATARLMETWAHGRDVADALGVTPVPTDRLRSIAHLGVRTRDFAYVINGLPSPTREFRIELAPPAGGEPWTWGPEAAPDSVTGSAEDFCLVVTQRRLRDATSLVATGEAERWLSFAQAFAGPPRGVR